MYIVMKYTNFTVTKQITLKYKNFTFSFLKCNTLLRATTLMTEIHHEGRIRHSKK